MSSHSYTEIKITGRDGWSIGPASADGKDTSSIRVDSADVSTPGALRATVKGPA